MKKYKYYGVSLCTGLLGFYTFTSCANKGNELGIQFGNKAKGVVATLMITGGAGFIGTIPFWEAAQSTDGQHSSNALNVYNNITNDTSTTTPLTTPNGQKTSSDSAIKCLGRLGSPTSEWGILVKDPKILEAPTIAFLERHSYSITSVQRVLDAGHHIDAQYKNGDTMLIALLKEINKNNPSKNRIQHIDVDQVNIIRCLLKGGASLSIKNRQGEDAIYWMDKLPKNFQNTFKESFPKAMSRRLSNYPSIKNP